MSVILKKLDITVCLTKGSLPLLRVVDEDGVTICKSVGCALWAVICTDPVSLSLQRGVVLTTRHTEESACALLSGEHWEVERGRWASTPRRCAPRGQSIFKHRGWESSQWWLYPAPMWGLSSTLLPHLIFLTFSAWPWASGTTLPFYSMCRVGARLPPQTCFCAWGSGLLHFPQGTHNDVLVFLLFC